jgi:hypothetical protein
VQQGHGIQPAGDGHQNRLPTLEQPAILDVLFNVLEQIGHAPMLLHWRDGASAAGFQHTNWKITAPV